MSPRPRFFTRYAPTLLLLVFSLLLSAAQVCAQQHWNLEETLVLTDVHVIDVRTGEVRQEQVVVIERTRITTVGSKGTRYPRNAPTVNAKGGYLIPGLWDMHVHLVFGDWFPLAQEISLPLFIANGVTSVRDMGSQLDTLQAFRNQIESAERLAPRILPSPPMPDWP